MSIRDIRDNVKADIEALVQLIHDIVEFITKDIWVLDFSKPQRFSKRIIRHIKVVLLTIRNYNKLRIGPESVVLSYYTLMALIPMVAIILFVTNSFGVDKILIDLAQPYLDQDSKIVQICISGAQNIISRLHSGLFGIISFGTFMWMVLRLMMFVENDFNRIFKINKGRVFIKRLGVYISILIITPFLLMLFLYGASYYTSFITLLGNYGFMQFIASKLYWVVFYGLAVLIMTAMYKFIPHEKIYIGACFKSALIVGAAFILIQYLYLGTQIMLAKTSAVYGVIAAIPLFMMWLQLSWQMILLGANLSYAFEHVDDYNPELDK